MIFFDTKPKTIFTQIGNENTGIIEVAEIGDLAIAEEIEYKSAVAKLEKITSLASNLATKISQQEKITFQQAKALIAEKEIQLSNNKDPELIRLTYEQDLLDITEKKALRSFEEKIIAATIMARRKLPPMNAKLERLKQELSTGKSSEQKTLEGEIAKLEKDIAIVQKWSVEDTKSFLTKSAVEMLYQFFLKESNGGVIPEASAPSFGEKQPKVEEPAAIDAKPELIVSGKKSTGDSKAINPPKKNA